MFSNRMWFAMFWFYLRAALFGDPVTRKPEGKAAVRAEAPHITQLKPAPHAK